jgi:signal transduction histidine kinase
MSVSSSAGALDQYLTVGEAAEFLGVSPWTLRNWDKAGKLKPSRHPKNGYRIYRQDDLRLIRNAQTGPTRRADLTPQFDWTEIGRSEHFVQFYESDDYLVEAVGGFLAAGVTRGDAGLIVVTPEHREKIFKNLSKRGIDVEAMQASGLLLVLDAAQTLEKISINGTPDSRQFIDVVGGVIGRFVQGGRRLRAFGEMVALLWADGHRSEAIALEDLWNALARSYSFALLCGYPMNSFAGDSHSAPFAEVCKCHSRVLPAESYASLSTPAEQLREISVLQQKAQALQAEIAHRQEVEIQLRKANTALELASKAKDQLLAVLSHELRTPLTPALIAAAALESEGGLTSKMRADLAMIRRNISLETKLIDDLLDLSRVVNGSLTLQKQDVTLHSLIAEVIAMVAQEAEAKSIKLVSKLNASNDRLYADSARVHQVIWNLLNNAIKFTPHGGNIEICTSNPADGMIAVKVRDSGVGIESKALKSIFNAFDQGEHAGCPMFGGLGLGLAISKAVIEIHDGRIRAESDGPGTGATFSITLPTAAAPAATEKSGSTPPPSSQARQHRILLVEDHADTLKVMRRLLETSGYFVVPAGTVADAVQAAKAQTFDLLISDIGLPDGSGLDLVRQIRQHQTNLQAVALTGFGMERDIQGSQRAGFVAHLTKPVDLAQLKSVIKSLLPVSS